MRSGSPCRALRLRSSAALLLVATSGCARHTTVDGATPAPASGGRTPAASAQIVLAVENHSWSDIVVSVLRNGHAHRLGTVTGASNAVLRFPAYYGEASTPLQLLAHPIGDPTVYRSERFVVLPGQQITWTLENSLVRSSLAVY
jgi:hypothetical protein